MENQIMEMLHKKINLNNKQQAMIKKLIRIIKVKNKYRTRLLVRFKKNLFAQKLINNILKKIDIPKKIKLTVDVDPLNFS